LATSRQPDVVLVQRDGFQEQAGLFVRLAQAGGGPGHVDLQRRDADRLPDRQPVLRIDALAVDPQFAFPDHALDMRKRQPGEPRLQKAVDAHSGFIGRHRNGLNPARGRGRGLWRIVFGRVGITRHKIDIQRFAWAARATAGATV
jgi:hypothetical protein